MNQIEFNKKYRAETKQLALEIIRLFKQLPKTEENKIIGKQLLRSATSVAANFRAVCRARSVRELFAKLSIVVEEADETVFWLEILEDAKLFQIPIATNKRALTITKVMASYRKKLKANRK